MNDLERWFILNYTYNRTLIMVLTILLIMLVIYLMFRTKNIQTFINWTIICGTNIVLLKSHEMIGMNVLLPNLLFFIFVMNCYDLIYDSEIVKKAIKEVGEVDTSQFTSWQKIIFMDKKMSKIKLFCMMNMVSAVCFMIELII